MQYVRWIVGVLVLLLSACSSVAHIHRTNSNRAFEFQELVGSQIGPSSAHVGAGARHGGVSALAYGGGDILLGKYGGGLRFGLGGDSGKGDGVDLRYGGYPLSIHGIVRPHPRVWFYTGLGYMIGGLLKRPDARTQIEVGGYLLYGGVRAIVLPFNERVQYSLFIELGSTSSFDTEIGAFNSRAVRFGSVLTF